MSIEWQLPIHSFHLNTYGTCPAIRYDYPEYDYMYAYTTLRPTAAPSPSLLDKVTKLISSGRCNWLQECRIYFWQQHQIPRLTSYLLNLNQRAAKFCKRLWWCIGSKRFRWIWRVVCIKSCCIVSSNFGLYPFVPSSVYRYSWRYP